MESKRERRKKEGGIGRKKLVEYAGEVKKEKARSQKVSKSLFPVPTGKKIITSVYIRGIQEAFLVSMMFVANFHTVSACAWSCGWIRDLISVVQKKALTLCGRERGKSFSSRFRKNVKGITEKKVGGGGFVSNAQGERRS